MTKTKKLSQLGLYLAFLALLTWNKPAQSGGGNQTRPVESYWEAAADRGDRSTRGEGEFLTSDCDEGDIHDDGVAENGYGFLDQTDDGTPILDGRIVEKFTPPCYPFEYKEVCVCWLTLNAVDQTVAFEVVFFDDDGGADGSPGTFLGSAPGIAANVPNMFPGQFYTVDVSSAGIVIPEGDVFIGVKLNPNVDIDFFVCADESPKPPFQDGWFITDIPGFNFWIPLWLPPFFPFYRALLIRPEGVLPCEGGTSGTCGAVPDSCCETHESGACNEKGCCLCVCDADPSCCMEAWDADCLAIAQNQCSEQCGCNPGACCDRRIANPELRCRDNVPERECLIDDEAQVSWTKGTLCTELDPACQEHTGACCDRRIADPSSRCRDNVPESQCMIDDPEQVSWHKGSICDPTGPFCVEHTGACCDRRIPDAAARCRDNVPQSQCVIDDPNQVSWTKDTLCADLDPSCTEHTGACCDRSGADGMCTDNVPGSQCIGDFRQFFKGLDCDDAAVQTCCADTDCNDEVACTNDRCDPQDIWADPRGCVFTPDHHKCPSDGVECTNERCFPGEPGAGPDGCISIPKSVNCDDLVDCTNDRCEPGNRLADPDGCVHSRNNDKCIDDGASCTNEVCDPGNPAQDASGCIHTPNDDKCPDDGVDCTNELCLPGPAADPVTGCIRRANDDKCEDFNECTENVCTAAAGCQFLCSDTEPPELHCNRRYVVLNCTRPDGAVPDEEDLFIKVSDNCDPDPMVSHDGPKVFPPTCGRGEPTVITVNAQDKCGNPAAPPCEIRVFVAGAMCCPGTIDTDLTLLPVAADLRQENEGPPITKARFDIWNQDERRYSGTERCIGCWDQSLLSLYEPPNHFFIGNLHTDKGKARIDGLSSALCEGSRALPLLAVAVKEIRFPLPWDKEEVVRSATVLRGLGEESAAIRFDLVPTSDEGNVEKSNPGRSASRAGRQKVKIGAATVRERTFEPQASARAKSPMETSSRPEGTLTLPSPLERERGLAVTPDGTDSGTAGIAGPADRASITIKGSVLYFPNVEVKWECENDATGRGHDTGGHCRLIQDTLLSLVNDHPNPVWVQLYLVQGDPPLEEVCDISCPPAPDGSCTWECLIEREHSGWNWVDTQMELTGNQPTYWSVFTGRPAGMQPWEILDPGVPPGRPDPDMANGHDRALRGFVIAWAVDVNGRQIRWNHLTGSAAIIHYRDTTSAEYEPWAFPCVSTGPTGGPCGAMAGLIELNGIDYASAPNMLLFDFYATGSEALSHPQIP